MRAPARACQDANSTSPCRPSTTHNTAAMRLGKWRGNAPKAELAAINAVRHFAAAPTPDQDSTGRKPDNLRTPNLRVAKRIVVGVIGGTVTLLGVALIVLPGPAFIVIPIGLSILATEFLWARRWLAKVRSFATRSKEKFMKRAGKQSNPADGKSTAPQPDNPTRQRQKEKAEVQEVAGRHKNDGQKGHKGRR